MNVEVTGVSATASVGQIWMALVPAQTANYANISPAQSPSWTSLVP